MTNRIIEDGLDFYAILYGSLDTPPDNTKDESCSTCLISGLPLTAHAVRLECNHSFNYIQLFQDVANHKRSFNNLETRQLKIGEMRCPYCRNIQTTLLPPCPELSLPNTHGVNCIIPDMEKEKEKPLHLHKNIGPCQYDACQCKTTKLSIVNGKFYCAEHYSVIYEELMKARQAARAQKEELKAKKLADKLKKEADKVKKEADKVKKEADKVKKEADKVKKEEEKVKKEEEKVKKEADKAKKQEEKTKKEEEKALKQAEKALKQTEKALKQSEKSLKLDGTIKKHKTEKEKEKEKDDNKDKLGEN